MTALTSEGFNHRLLSEMICLKDFQRMMRDAETYVDRIADMRITNMNAAMEILLSLYHRWCDSTQYGFVPSSCFSIHHTNINRQEKLQ